MSLGDTTMRVPVNLRYVIEELGCQREITRSYCDLKTSRNEEFTREENEANAKEAYDKLSVRNKARMVVTIILRKSTAA